MMLKTILQNSQRLYHIRTAATASPRLRCTDPWLLLSTSSSKGTGGGETAGRIRHVHPHNNFKLYGTTVTAQSDAIENATTTTTTPSGNDNNTMKIDLYQYAICPFCNTVKTMLNYARIDYRAIEVNPLTKSQIKTFKPQYSKVPIATITTTTTTHDTTNTKTTPYFGSDVIIQELLKQPIVQQNLHHRWTTSTTTGSTTMTLSEFQNSSSAQQWTEYAIQELAVLLYPNMCRTMVDSYQSFNYVHNQPNTFNIVDRILIQNVGALAMYIAASRIKKKRNIHDERQALEDVIVRLEQGLIHSGTYLSGMDHPNRGDITVFGTLRAIDGLPIHQKLITDRGGPIVDWYNHMKVQTTGSS